MDTLTKGLVHNWACRRFAPTLEHKACHISVRLSGIGLSSAALSALERELAQGMCVLSGSSNLETSVIRVMDALRNNTIERISLDSTGDVVRFPLLGLAIKGNSSLKFLTLYNILSAGAHMGASRTESGEMYSPVGEIADAVKVRTLFDVFLRTSFFGDLNPMFTFWQV